MASDESTGRLEGCLGFRELEVEEGGSDMTLSRIKAAADHYHHHQDVVWTWTCFGKVAKGIMKQHPQGTVSKLGQLGEVYNEVAVFARTLEREDLVQILSQLCSGLLELEDHRQKLERSHIDEESDEESDDSGRQSTSPGGFKIFVGVLRFGVDKMAYESGDDLLESFDLLSQACWCTIESMRSLPPAHLTIRLGVPKDVEFVEANLGLCMLLLGTALTALGDEEDGLNYMESAYEMFQFDLESTLSTHHLQLVLARAYAEGGATKDHRKAARMFEAAATTAKDLHTMLVMDMEAASHWIKVPEERVTKGVTKIEAVLEQALQILPMEWALQARLYFEAGTAHLEAGGDMEDHQAVEYLEAATRLCVDNDFSAAFLAQDSHGHVRVIVMGLAQLLALYSSKENLAAALALHQAVNPILVKLKSVTSDENLWKDTAWRVWQQALDVFKEATGTGYYVNVKEVEISSRIGWDISEFMLKEKIGGGKTYRFAMADHFQNLADAEAENLNWAGAVNNMNLLEEKLRRRGVLTNKAKVGLHVNRANYFMSGGQLSQASEEIQKALEITHEEDDQDQDRSIMRKIYTTQSRIFWELHDLDAALASLDKAEMACKHRGRHLRGLRMLRGDMLMKSGKLEMAEELARETALACAEAQSELGFESAWVHYLDNTGMGVVFSNVEYLHRRKKDAMTALIWAERGRARLFMHRADPSGAKEFDKSDQFAVDILRRTIEMCGPGTVILEFSIVADSLFVIYALFFHPKEGVICATHERSLDEFFEKPENRVAGKKLKLEDLVVKVRQDIRAGRDDKAIPGLTILHTLLVQNVWNKYPDWLSFCTHIIFSPHGKLHLVPFMALYNGTAEKYLIEQKAISVIPSICALVHCFARQQKFETKFQSLDSAFIAGNPEPMGVKSLSLKPLRGAAEEAQNVAKILGVEACKGENITKEAVITALKSSSVVLLATHGLGAKHNYPFGAVALRRMSVRSDEYNEAPGITSTNPEQDEVLTSEEIIASIEGGISAGLVVLSACFTGMGEVSREGLLGLGHALLEAGASSAIVDLWDVNDGSIGILIADVFKELKNGTDLVHSVQKAVVDMLRGPERRKIQDWSALTLLGSPSFQLPGHVKVTNSKQDILDKDYRHASQLLADDIGGSAMYLRAVVHYYAVQAKQREDEGDFDTAIAVVNFLEKTLQKNGLASGDIAKSKIHLWRGIYMNQINGRSLEALKELQKAIDLLVDVDETSSELVALVFLEQARAYLKFRDRNAARTVLDRALESMAKSSNKNNNNNMLLDYHCKVFRCFALSDDREFKAAESLVGEAAHLEADSPNIWIPFVDDKNLRSAFSLYEKLSFGQGDVNKAVVWAEQGLIDVVDSSRDHNTETDSAAASSMLETVGLCGPNTIIIKFSYDHQNLLMLYGLSSKVSVCSRKYLKGFFREDSNRVMGSSLEELLSRVRQCISKGEDEVAVLGLSILYNLLVKPIFVDYKEYFAGYTKIIFAPQGFLCKVPFGALYDASEGKFLVEQVAVGVIPSLRSLQRCFSRQDTCLKHSNAFVGGNPEQLPGTGEAAHEVAGILDVEACPGSNLIKETVLQEAFRTCDIVVLATLAVNGKREQPYPYGAMVLKPQDTGGHDGQVVMTCEEVAALAGKMRASLVVTIGACHKDDEQDDSDAVDSEGLLGLGHAALAAGAVTAIASLWDVNDDVLTPLISSLFRELKQGKDVLCSMQKAMKDMVRSTEIRHWASLTVLGSPTLQISTPAQTTDQPAPAPAPESKNQTVVSLDFLQKNCLKVLDVVTELGPLHTLPQDVCGTVLENLAAVEIEKMKKAELEGCDLVGEIVGCGYLGMVYGGMGDWNTARRWLVRSLSAAKENWELVKDTLEPDPLALSALYISFLLRLHGTSSLNSDLDLIRFVLRSTVPSNERVFDNIHQVLAFWE